MSEPSLDKSLSEAPSERRLDSWKEIALYLHRDVTTVQRWEKQEGMPVHRHLHHKRGSVYGLSSELDAWWQSRKLRFEDEPEPALEAPADASGPQTTVPRGCRWIVLSSAAVVLAALVTPTASYRKATLKFSPCHGDCIFPGCVGSRILRGGSRISREMWVADFARLGWGKGAREPAFWSWGAGVAGFGGFAGKTGFAWTGDENPDWEKMGADYFIAPWERKRFAQKKAGIGVSAPADAVGK